MSKILVIGGAGYIGGLVTDKLQETNLDGVHVYDNLLYEDRYFKNADFTYGDIRDTEKVAQVCATLRPDVVVILAALVGDAACNINPELTEEINHQAVKRICKKLDKNIHIIFTSTCSVYGFNKDIVSEVSETNPLSCYASTKLKAEADVLNRCGTVFRLGTVYGVGDRFSRIRADLVVNTLTVKAFSEGQITVNGGEQWRPIISVKDIAGYVAEACTRRQVGVFNLAHSNVQIHEIADDIKKAFPLVDVKRVDTMFQDSRNYKVSVEKSMNNFSYTPKISVLDEIVQLKDLLVSRRIKDPNINNYHNGLYLSDRRF